MSIRYVATVLDNLPNLSATETLVLVALADFASDDTRECWPSIATVARRARCDRRTAQRCLKKLEARGFIDRAIGGHQYGRNTASRYRLKFDYAGELVPDVEPTVSVYPQGRQSAAGGAAPTTHKGGARDIQGRHGAAPSVIRTVIEPKSDKSRASKERDPREYSDDELEELASTGRLTAVLERERELRRRMKARKASKS